MHFTFINESSSFFGVAFLTCESDFEQVQRVEDDGGDDPAADAGQEVLILGRPDRRDEARDPPPNDVAATRAPRRSAAHIAAHVFSLFGALGRGYQRRSILKRLPRRYRGT